MRQPLHRLPPKRGFWSINRDRNLAAARKSAAAAGLPPPVGPIGKTAEAPVPARGRAHVEVLKA
jgi:hypothetical protein